MSHKNEVQEAYGEGEGQYVEFKENTDSKKIGETVSAFANTNDGIIIIGVRDRTKEITGIEIGKGTLESIANTVKTNTDPKIFPAWIESCKFERKSVIAIKIKENDEKPVFYNGKTFKRVGKTNQKMSVSEMKKLLSESRRMYFDG
jgi:ATP-dependent DNA helicase RecG